MLTTFFDLLEAMSEKVYNNFIVMVGGIILKDVEQNPHAIAKTIGAISHDSLEEF